MIPILGGANECWKKRRMKTSKMRSWRNTDNFKSREASAAENIFLIIKLCVMPVYITEIIWCCKYYKLLVLRTIFHWISYHILCDAYCTYLTNLFQDYQKCLKKRWKNYATLERMDRRGYPWDQKSKKYKI